jgi:hypothetical protein
MDRTQRAPKRLDLDWRWWPLAKQKGVKCVINPMLIAQSAFKICGSESASPAKAGSPGGRGELLAAWQNRKALQRSETVGRDRRACRTSIASDLHHSAFSLAA